MKEAFQLMGATLVILVSLAFFVALGCLSYWLTFTILINYHWSLAYTCFIGTIMVIVSTLLKATAFNEDLMDD